MKPKVITTTGYAAFDKVTGKGLRNYCSQWINKWGLTDDPEHVYIVPNKGFIENAITWYNEQHKNKINFEIKTVSMIQTTEIVEVK